MRCWRDQYPESKQDKNEMTLRREIFCQKFQHEGVSTAKDLKFSETVSPWKSLVKNKFDKAQRRN